MDKDYMLRMINERIKEIRQEKSSIRASDKSAKCKSVHESNLNKEHFLILLVKELLDCLPKNFYLEEGEAIKGFERLVTKRAYNYSDKVKEAAYARRKDQ